jgi:GGDEF domain-containing protein
VSIGVAVNGDQPLDVPELLRQADQALYHAKERWVELASLDLVLPRKEGAANVRLAAKTAA